jgi:subtilisin family serine protease
MRTELSESGRVLVFDDISSDTPQAFTVCIKNPSDWEEIHNYIINENEIDGIPNRRITCISEMQCSSKRSVYEMSINEAEVLRQHSKVEWVEKSSMHNPTLLEQRKYDEEFDKHTDTDRFRQAITNRRTSGNPGVGLTFTQWGLYRHQSTTNNFDDDDIIAADCQYSLTGKNVDVVIMDTGVRWDHPEFLKPGVSSFSTKADTRVRDILIHGAEEYGINWASEGLVAPGSGSLSNYTVANVLESSSFNGSWHGSHVAGTAAGNQFGAAFEANIWSIACIDRSDVGWSEPSDAFDYIKVWHKNKPVNPEKSHSCKL